jgi:RNA polymerase sigma-70 factor, ECF subfamily
MWGAMSDESLLARIAEDFIGKYMTGHPNDTQGLLDGARGGDPFAFEELFRRHRGRLQKAIAMRIDRRVAARVDASDVLQETYMEAFRRLPKYLQQEKMPFYLWLLWIAREKVLHYRASHNFYQFSPNLL